MPLRLSQVELGLIKFKHFMPKHDFCMYGNMSWHCINEEMQKDKNMKQN